VRRAIDDYVRGIERGDRGAVRRVRTTLSSFEERLLSATEPVSIRFDELQIDVVGPDRARVSARQVVERTDVQPRRQEGRVQLVLTRNGGGDWRITSLQATPGPR
jgi:ketosteroid isomerase-like protein